MAAASCRCSSVVFVGNLPYHASEAEVRAACEEIGPVVSLRVAADRATGRPRGFAFAEYRDDETALSACRNLHGRALRGRDLRVGLAQRAAAAPGDEAPVGVEAATHAATLLPPGAGPPRDAVTLHLAGMTRRQLRVLLDDVAREDPALVERARRAYAGLATLIEQARVLLDVAATRDDEARAARKRAGGSPPAPAGQEPAKLRRTEHGGPGPGVACR